MPTAGWDTATKLDPQHPRQAPGKAQWRRSPSLACAIGAPRAGLAGRGWLVPLWGQHVPGLGVISSCGDLAPLRSVGAAVFG